MTVSPVNKKASLERAPFIALQNPVLTLRELARMSQETFATIAEVDTQFIYRLENGLVNSIPDRIFEDTFYYVDYQTMTATMMNQFIGAKRPTAELTEISRLVGKTADNIPSEHANLEKYAALCQFWYRTWVLSRRERIRQQLNAMDFALPERGGAPKAITPVQFREWVMSYFPSEEGTTHSFCRKFLIHPSTVQRWEKQKKSTAPPTIVKAMAESGINIAGRVFK